MAENNPSRYILKNEIHEIPKLLELVPELSNQWGFNDKNFIYEIKVALEEMLSNIIQYAFTDQKEHLIEVIFEKKSNEVTITIIDDGFEFNPLEAVDPDLDLPLEEKPIGGLGIFIVKNFMDEMEHSYIDNKNILKLKKNFKKGIA